MAFFDLILNLIYPPRCVHCDEILDFDSYRTLCPKCEKLFESEKNFECPICRLSHRECICTPQRMRIDKALHISEYSQEESVTRSLVLASKDRKYKRMFEFVANEAADLLRYHTDNFENSVICYVPRDPDRKLKIGFDQSEYTAELIARKLGIKKIKAIKRLRAAQQKSLTLEERDENAKAAYEKIDKMMLSVYKKNVILYDDVMTSGATLHACARLIKQMGAKSVTALTLGRTYSDSEKKTGAIMYVQR